MAKQLNVDMRFTADTSKAKQSITELQQAIQKLGYSSAPKDIVNAAEFEKAANSARELAYHLNNAYNAKTGNLDLSKLNNSLKESGTSLEKLTANFKNAGTTGQQAFVSLANSIAAADQPAISLNTHLSTMFTTLKNVARFQLSSSIMHGLIGGIQTAFNYAKDLNESLNNIRIVTGQSTEQMARFADQANKTARSLSSTTLDYTKASLIYYQQGLSDAEVKARADVTVKLANVSRQSAQEVSNQMTAIWNNFDNGAHSMEYFADVITALGATTASSSEEIATGLQKFAPIAGTIGLSYEKATAALATLVANTRQSAETVGTGLRTIFSRFEGLKLGETLEDGVDLNKYSKAMQTIGVNILDANGQLKDMDTILDQIAERWQQLDNTQKTAFATTVGGVRQYTNLMALFENWDDMQTNLQTALGSEGSLQTQADIYAESWEAARDRVKTALQSIYQDLLDDNFFISITKGFETILSGIDSFIDKIGGVKTLITGLAGFIGMNISNKIGPAMQKMIQDIQILTGGAKTVYTSMQQSFSNQVSKELASGAYSDTTKAQLESSNALLLAKTKLSAVNNQLSASEKMQAEVAIQGLELQIGEVNKLVSSVEGYQKKQDTANKAVDKSINNLIATYQKLNTTMSTTGNNSILSGAKKGITDYAKTAGIDISSLNLEQVTSQVDSCAASIRAKLIGAFKESAESAKAAGTSIIDAFSNVKVDLNTESLTNFINNIKNLSTTDLSKAKAEFAGLKDSFSGLESIIPGIKEKINEAFAAGDAEKFKAAIQGIQTALQNVTLTEENFVTVFKTFGASQADINRIENSIKALKDRMGDAADVTALLEEELGKLKTQLGQVQNSANNIEFTHFVTGTEMITSIASAAGSAAMAIQSLKSVFKTLNDENMSWGEKLTSILMSISLITPGVINIVKGLGIAKTFLTQQTMFTTAATTRQMIAEGLLSKQQAKSVMTQNLLTLGLTKETAATAAHVLLTYKLTTAKSQKMAIEKLEGLGIERNTAVQLVNNATHGSAIKSILTHVAAKMGLITAENAETAAVNLNTAAWLANPIGLVIAGIAALIAIIVILNKRLNENTNELDNAKTSAENFKTSLEDIQTYAENIKTSFDGYESILQRLNECEAGTSAWRDTMKELATYTDDMLAKYPILAKYSEYLKTDDVTGYTYLTQEGIDFINSQIEQEEAAIKIAKTYIDKRVATLEAEQKRSQVSSSYTDNAGRVNTISTQEDVDTVKEYITNWQETLSGTTEEILNSDYFSSFGKEMQQTILLGLAESVHNHSSEWSYNDYTDLMNNYSNALSLLEALSDSEDFNTYYSTIMEAIQAGVTVSQDYINEMQEAAGVTSSDWYYGKGFRTGGRKQKNLDEEFLNNLQIYGKQSQNIDSMQTAVDDYFRQITQIDDDLKAVTSTNFDSIVTGLLQKSSWYQSISDKGHIKDQATGYFDTRVAEQITETQEAVNADSTNKIITDIARQWVETVYGTTALRSNLQMNDKGTGFNFNVEENGKMVQKTVDISDLIDWDSTKFVLEHFNEDFSNYYQDAITSATEYINRTSQFNPNNTNEKAFKFFAENGNFNNLDLATLENLSSDQQLSDFFRSLEKIDPSLLEILGINLDDVKEKAQDAVNAFKDIPSAIKDSSTLDLENLTLANIKMIEEKMHQVSLGPAGKSAGEEYINQLGTALQGVKSEDYAQALSQLLSVDLNSIDSLDQIQSILKQYGVDIDITDEAWTTWLTHMQSQLNIVAPSFESLKDTITTIIPLVQGLKYGDTIKAEDYETLVKYNKELEKYFSIQYDGSYRYTGETGEAKGIAIQKISEDKTRAIKVNDYISKISERDLAQKYTITDINSYQDDGSLLQAIASTPEGMSLLGEISPEYADTSVIQQIISEYNEGNRERYDTLIDALVEAFNTDYLGQVEGYDDMLASTASTIEELNSLNISPEAYNKQLSHLKRTALEACTSVDDLIKVMKEFSDGGQDIDPNDENFVKLLNEIVTEGTAACTTIEDLQKFYEKMKSISSDVDSAGFTDQAHKIIQGKISSVNSSASAAELKAYIQELSNLDFIDESTVSTWLAELALAGYDCVKPFENMKTIFSELVNVVGQLDFGKTISDEAYQKLIAYNDAWKKFFIMQADGTHAFIGNADDMKQFTLDQIEAQRQAIEAQKKLVDDAFNAYNEGGISGKSFLTSKETFANTDFMQSFVSSKLGKDILASISPDLVNIDIDSIIADYQNGNKDEYNKLVGLLIDFFTTNYQEQLDQTDEMVASTAKTIKDLQEMYSSKNKDKAYEKRLQQLKQEALNSCKTIEDLNKVLTEFSENGAAFKSTEYEETLNNIVTEGAAACDTIEELQALYKQLNQFSKDNENVSISTEELAKQANTVISGKISSLGSYEDAQKLIEYIKSISDLDFISDEQISEWLYNIALSGYAIKTPFEELKTILIDIVNVLGGLKFGDIISDDAYQKLIAYNDAWKNLFFTMADGSHRFIGDSSEMMDYTLKDLNTQKDKIEEQRDLQRIVREEVAGDLTNKDTYNNADWMKNFATYGFGKNILEQENPELFRGANGEFDISKLQATLAEGPDSENYQSLVKIFTDYFSTNFDEQLAIIDQMIASTATTFSDLAKLQGGISEKAYADWFNYLAQAGLEACKTLEDYKALKESLVEGQEIDPKVETEWLTKTTTEGIAACKTLEELKNYLDQIKEVNSDFFYGEKTQAGLIEATETQIPDLLGSGMTSANSFSDLSSLFSNAQYLSGTGDISQLLPENFEEDFNRIINKELESCKTMADLNSLLETTAELINQAGVEADANFFSNLQSEGLIQVASSYKNAASEAEHYKNVLASGNEQQIESAKADLENAVAAGEAAEAYGLDAESVELLTDSYRKKFDSWKDEEGMVKSTAEAAKDAAVRYLRLNNAIEDLSNNSETYSKVLKKLNKQDSERATKTLATNKNAQQLRKTLSNLLDTSEEFISVDFMKSIKPKDLEAAANGSEKAINKIRKAFVKATAEQSKLFQNMDVPGHEGEDNVKGLQSELAGLDSMKEGATLDLDTMPFLTALIQAQLQAGASAADIQNMLSGFGIDADVTPFEGSMEEAAAAAEEGASVITAAMDDVAGSGTDATVNQVEDTAVDTQEDYDVTETVTWEPVKSEGDQVLEEGAAQPTGVTQQASELHKKVTYTPADQSSKKTASAPAIKIENANKSSGGKADKGKTKKTGGGGGGGKTKKKDAAKADKGTRYHTIRAKQFNNANRQTVANRKKERAFGAERIKQAQKVVDLQREQIVLQKEYLEEIKKNIKVDRDEMQKAFNALGLKDKNGKGLSLKIDKDGVIENFQEIEDALLEKENELIKKYNRGAIDDEKFEEEKKKLDELREAITDYEETQDLYEEELDKLQEYIDAIADAALELLKTKIQLQIDIKEDDLNFLDYMLEKIDDNAYKAAEALSLFGQQTENYLDQLTIYEAGLNELLRSKGLDPNKLGSYDTQTLLSAGFTQAEIDQIKEWRDAILDANNSLLDMRKNIIDKVIDTFDQLNEKVGTAYDLFESYSTVLENYKDITEVLGRHINKEQRKLMNDLSKAMLDNAKTSLSTAKSLYDNMLQEQAEAKKRYDEAIAAGDEETARQWEEILNSINEATREAQETWLSQWQETTDMIQEIFESMLDQLVEDFDKAMSGSFGSLDYLDEAYSRQQETDDLYLDDYDKLYELNKKLRDLNKALSDQNLTNRRAMLELQKDMNAAQESGVKLSQYDLDVFEKRFEILKAYNDLQMAQNAKNQVRLQRDNEGNWGYVYTANEDKVAEAEQAYEDKLHEYQKLNDDYIKELQEKALEAQKTYRDTLREIMEDVTLSDEEREARIQELNDWYLSQQEYFEEQSNHVFDNQASTLERYLNTYKTAIDNLIDTWEETSLADLTGLSSLDEYMNNWMSSSAEFLEGLRAALDDRKQQVEEILALSGTSIEDFGNQAQTAINDIGDASQSTAQEVLSLASILDDNFNAALEEAVNWEKEYAQNILDATSANEQFIQSINEMIAKLSDLSSIETDEYMKKRNQYLNGEITEEQWFEWLHAYYRGQAETAKTASYDTGGYTGVWGPGGRLAILHEKEEVFNAEDTGKLLDAARILRTIDIQADKFSNGLGTYLTPFVGGTGMKFEQEVHITAEFPNAVNHLEIEEAFNNLANKATQYANRKT